jgi:hypothetical protein
VGFAFPARGVWGRELRARARDFFRHARALSASSRLCGSGLVYYQRNLLLANWWWLICSERKLLLAGE